MTSVAVRVGAALEAVAEGVGAALVGVLVTALVAVVGALVTTGRVPVVAHPDSTSARLTNPAMRP